MSIAGHRQYSFSSISSAVYKRMKLHRITLTTTKSKVSGVLSSLGNNFVDDTILLSLLRRHDVVAFHVLFNPLQVLCRMFREDLIQNRSYSKDLFRMDFDIGG